MQRLSSEELPYQADSTDVLVELPELVISELTLLPGQEVPWHFHNHITDTFYCLKGCTSIRHAPNGHVKLNPGESFAVPSGTSHQVEAFGNVPCKFLIIQGVGEYDFVPAQKPPGHKHND